MADDDPCVMVQGAYLFFVLQLDLGRHVKIKLQKVTCDLVFWPADLDNLQNKTHDYEDEQAILANKRKTKNISIVPSLDQIYSISIHSRLMAQPTH